MLYEILSGVIAVLGPVALVTAGFWLLFPKSGEKRAGRFYKVFLAMCFSVSIGMIFLDAFENVNAALMRSVLHPAVLTLMLMIFAFSIWSSRRCGRVEKRLQKNEQQSDVKETV